MNQNNNGSVTLSGTAQASTQVSVLDGTAKIGTATVAANGTWSFITSKNLSNTVHIFTATDTDSSGNVSGTSGTAQLGSSLADKLSSTAGNDVFAGDGGANTFSFAAYFGNDVITDFVQSGSHHDVINFKGNSVLNSYAAVVSHASNTSLGVVIRQDANNSLTLLDLSKGDLRSADFTFS
jgi:hypothetical protein